MIKFLKHLFFFVFLSALTQIGGLIWLLSVLIAHKTKRKKRYVFAIAYLFLNLFIIPPIAKQFGRVSLPIIGKELKPRNWIYPLLFRNYVNPKLKHELENSAHVLYKSGITITYLDANFPFLDGFPLPPHLSHNDGKKIDISFMYLDSQKKSTNKKPSLSGYGVYVNSEKNKTIKSCINKGYWQYDFSKYLTFGTINKLEFDNSKTKLLIQQLLSNKLNPKDFYRASY